SADPLERKIELGMLPMPRKDMERLHQIITLQPRLMDLRAPFRAQRALLHRHVLQDALTWLEIHGERPELVQHWRSLQAEPGPGAPHAEGSREGGEGFPHRRRRRRRRRRRYPSQSPRE